MILCMSMSLETYEALEREGTLLSRSDTFGPEGDFALPYAWMRGRMRSRIAGYGGDSMWWGFARWEGTDGPYPDLRSRGWHWGTERHMRTMLALDVPDGEVLLSCHDCWHNVLMGHMVLPGLGSLPDDEIGRIVDADPGWSLPWEERFRHPEITSDWESILDVSASGCCRPQAARDVQATFETLRMADVAGVRHFTSRPTGTCGTMSARPWANGAGVSRRAR